MDGPQINVAGAKGLILELPNLEKEDKDVLIQSVEECAQQSKEISCFS